jgi:uncharacterized protein (TIGR02391 family)
MQKRNPLQPTGIVPKEWKSVDEIDRAVIKIQRRISELESFDVYSAVINKTKSDGVLISNIKETIRDLFGNLSPEFREHQHLSMWVGGIVMDERDAIDSVALGRKQAIGKLNGLIDRLKEKKEDMELHSHPNPNAALSYLNLNPRIAEVSSDLFENGHHWEAVFAASKALVNYVKERSDIHNLDGAPLMRSVFSRNNPVLKFNELGDQTDCDKQEGMMHLFEGVVLGIRNPGGHSFPDGPAQRAVEYLSLISLLANKVHESKRNQR